MELWIRSQDRENLVKVDRLTIDDTNSIFCDYNDFYLGTYETKERALEVLDSIHSCIQTNAAFDLYAKLGSFADDFNNKYNLVPVYEMPVE